MEAKKNLVGQVEELIRLRQETARKYQLRKKEVVDFDIRSTYDVLQLACEGDESRLRTLIDKL